MPWLGRGITIRAIDRFWLIGKAYKGSNFGQGKPIFPYRHTSGFALGRLLTFSRIGTLRSNPGRSFFYLIRDSPTFGPAGLRPGQKSGEGVLEFRKATLDLDRRYEKLISVRPNRLILFFSGARRETPHRYLPHASDIRKRDGAGKDFSNYAIRVDKDRDRRLR